MPRPPKATMDAIDAAGAQQRAAAQAQRTIDMIDAAKAGV